MKTMLRQWLSVTLCIALLSGTAGAVPPLLPAQASQGIEPLLKKSYLQLLELAPELSYSSQQIKQVRERLKKEEDSKKDELKRQQKGLETRIKQAQEELKKLNAVAAQDTEEIAAQRHDIHCRIQSLQTELTDNKVALQNGIPVEYENLQAKLDLIEKWPAEKRRIDAELASGQSRARRWGDVQDIGYREIEPNQADDIKAGREAVQEMKQMGMMPKELEDEVVVEYINRLAQNVARNSDLKVSLNVTVLNSKEINAFALPGGFLFVNRGLIQETQNEAQLAGVIAHEISHDVARHGHKLMKRATIASIIYQAAQIGAMVLTGGAVGIGMYYALQYGFQGLGLLLSLQLLGVSRDYELEADLLGVQYTWKAGYDPEGFIQFFDVMASKEGYVEKTSFFRTHPAFYERIVTAYREISFLPDQPESVENTKEFLEIQNRLVKIAQDMEREEAGAPTLHTKEKGCPDQTPDKKSSGERSQL